MTLRSNSSCVSSMTACVSSAIGCWGRAGRRTSCKRRISEPFAPCRSTVAERGSFRSWLYRIIYRLCLDELRRARCLRCSGRRASTSCPSQMNRSQTSPQETASACPGHALQRGTGLRRPRRRARLRLRVHRNHSRRAARDDCVALTAPDRCSAAHCGSHKTKRKVKVMPEYRDARAAQALSELPVPANSADFFPRPRERITSTGPRPRRLARRRLVANVALVGLALLVGGLAGAALANSTDTRVSTPVTSFQPALGWNTFETNVLADPTQPDAGCGGDVPSQAENPHARPHPIHDAAIGSVLPGPHLYRRFLARLRRLPQRSPLSTGIQVGGRAAPTSR